MKKIIILLSIILFSISLASCVRNKEKDIFNNLYADLSGAVSLGIANSNIGNVIKYDDNIALSSQAYNLSTSNHQTELIKVDSNGNIFRVDFKDSNGNIIEIAFNLFYFDIIGDFIYLVYYLDDQDLVMLNDSFINYHYQSPNKSLIDSLFYDRIDGGEGIRRIVIHNKTGKVFDFTQIFNDIVKADDTYIHSYFSHEEGQFFSSFKIDDKTCINTSFFDSDKENLKFNQLCTDARFVPIYGIDNDHILFINDSGLNLMKEGISSEFHVQEGLRIFKTDDQHLGLMYQDTLEIYNKSFDKIRTIGLNIGSNRIQRFYTHYNGKLIFLLGKDLIIYDLDDEEVIYRYDLSNYSDEMMDFSLYIAIDNLFYLFSEKVVILIDLISLESRLIYQGSKNHSLYETIVSYRANGNFKISYTDGIVNKIKIIDAITGEEITEIESEVSKSIWHVKPLN